MNIKIVKDKISLDELSEIAKEFYYPMLKGVVDIDKEIVAFGGEYHMDANLFLQEQQGLEQKNIWGFNIYLDRPKTEWLEYTSLINIRPNEGNRSMVVEDQNICSKMESVINSKVIC